MKYKFKFDENFLADKYVLLSAIEKTVVMSVILGRHNAVFYGYEPERLVNIIKMLKTVDTSFVEVPKNCSIVELCGGGSELKQGYMTDADKGILYMPDLQGYRSSVISMLTPALLNRHIVLSRGGNTVIMNADFQLIATVTVTDDTQLNKTNSVCSSCGIVYRCVENVQREPVSLSKIQEEIDLCRAFKPSLKTIDSSVNPCLVGLKDIHLTDVANDFYRDFVKHTDMSDVAINEITRVARTLADIRRHPLARQMDIQDAIDMHKNPVSYTE